VPVIPFHHSTPSVESSAFVAPNAWIIGDVVVGAFSSILFGVVIRGDLETIVIGGNSNIQDNSVLHTSRTIAPLTIGDYVSIGHSSVLHSCTIENGAMVGMHSTVLDKAHIGEGAFIGAHSLVPQEMVIPPFHLVYGVPAKVKRPLTSDERRNLRTIAERYVTQASTYKSMLS
jgi:carbonic anhydrase/acetyltransferase-like protein (isoleucine patch superfamily)